VAGVQESAPAKWRDRQVDWQTQVIILLKKIGNFAILHLKFLFI